MSDRPYELDIDGPLLRKQRQWLLDAMFASTGQFDIIAGLINLTDAIANQAHDKYQIDCLLTEDTDG